MQHAAQTPRNHQQQTQGCYLMPSPGKNSRSGQISYQSSSDDLNKEKLTLGLKQLFQDIPREPLATDSPPLSPRAHSKNVTIDHMEFQTVLFLSHNSQLRHYRANEHIVSTGDRTQDIFYIFRGIVNVIDENGNVLAAMHDGSFCCEHAYFYQCPRYANVIAQQPCEIFRLDQSFLISMQREFPTVYAQLRRVAMARHLQAVQKGLFKQPIVPQPHLTGHQQQKEPHQQQKQKHQQHPKQQH